MKTEHPITPPPELIEDWHAQLQGDPCPVEDATAAITLIATQAARWGADQELEACCDVLARWGVHGIDKLRAARRPKPPSLRDQALDAFAGATFCTPEDKEIILRALEALPDV